MVGNGGNQLGAGSHAVPVLFGVCSRITGSSPPVIRRSSAVPDWRREGEKSGKFLSYSWIWLPICLEQVCISSIFVK